MRENDDISGGGNFCFLAEGLLKWGFSDKKQRMVFGGSPFSISAALAPRVELNEISKLFKKYLRYSRKS